MCRIPEGSHSWPHPQRMSECSRNELEEEWSKSVMKLDSITGEQIRVESVPGGHFSNDVARAASVCEIKALFTRKPIKASCLVDDCLVFGRYTLLRGIEPEVSIALATKGASLVQASQYLY